MGEKDIAFAVVQRKPSGGFQVTVPKREVAETFGLKGKERLKVFIDEKRRRWIYQLVE